LTRLLAGAGLLVGCSSPAAVPPTSTPPESTRAAATVAPSSALSTAVSRSAPAGEPHFVTMTPSAAPSTAEPAPEPSPLEPPEPEQSSTATAGFTSSVHPIDAELAARMSSSWRAGCPVDLSELSDLTLTYRGFDGADHDGELVVASSVAPDVVDIFRALYEQGYPIASMRLVDDFGADDDASMAADNSSAFNCRPVTGGGGFSEHSYGTAIDLNPVENPYLSGNLVLPPAGGSFADRHDAPGVILAGDAVVTAFADHGWHWGGIWSGPIDYQHFSVSGR
jgi:hypothetical protein